MPHRLHIREHKPLRQEARVRNLVGIFTPPTQRWTLNCKNVSQWYAEPRDRLGKSNIS